MAIRLEAMSDSGDVFITQDPAGQRWLHQAFGGEAPEKIDEGGLARAISFGDLTPVKRDFDSYEDLDKFLEEQGVQYLPAGSDPLEVTVDEATFLIGVATRWITTGTAEESAEAKDLLLTILENPVGQDNNIRAEITCALRLVDPKAADEAEVSSAYRARYRAVMTRNV